MDTSYNQLGPQAEIKSYNDPIPAFIEKLMYSDQIEIKLRTDMENSGKTLKDRYLIDVFTDYVNDSNARKHYDSLNRHKKLFPTKTQKLLCSKLANIPVYAIVNKNNDFIITVPSTSAPLIEQNNNQNTTQTTNTTISKKSTLLFFMNKNDASMYMQEMCGKESSEAEKLGLRIITTGLKSFYTLNRSYSPDIDTRLIADLSEVEYVANNKPTNNSYRLHPKQRYSKNYFQGTPIYIIKPTKNQSKGMIAETPKSTLGEEQVVFFKRNDAINFWKEHCKSKQGPGTNLPNIELYNLESLLIEIETSNIEQIPNYSFFISKETSETFNYPDPNEIQKLHTHSKLERFLFHARLKLENIQRIYKGLTWLFTSSTPPNEENAW